MDVKHRTTNSNRQTVLERKSQIASLPRQTEVLHQLTMTIVNSDPVVKTKTKNQKQLHNYF